MSYVYILKGIKDNKRYIGSTINLEKRVRQHEEGHVESTKNRRPLMLFAYREFDTISEASLYEKKYKRSSGQIQRDIKNHKLKIIGA